MEKAQKISNRTSNEKRTASSIQRKKILGYLQKHGSMTTAQAINEIDVPGHRIGNLVDELRAYYGIPIEEGRVKVRREDGAFTAMAQYVLRSEKEFAIGKLPATSSQRTALLEYLRIVGPITDGEARRKLGIGRCAARIEELRRYYMIPIETQMIQVRNKNGTLVYVAKYVLNNEPDYVKEGI